MAGPFEGLLEPRALDAGAVHDAATMVDVAALSLAMSAKRIADALEKANEPLEVCGEMAPTEEEIAARPSSRIATALERIAEMMATPQRGTCRICGCTHFEPCPEGCSWADASETLCDNPECLRKAGTP